MEKERNKGEKEEGSGLRGELLQRLFLPETTAATPGTIRVAALLRDELLQSLLPGYLAKVNKKERGTEESWGRDGGRDHRLTKNTRIQPG